MMNVQPDLIELHDRQVLSTSTASLSAQHIPFGKAILGLFTESFGAMINPSAQLFDEAKKRATWSLIFVQFLLLALLIGVNDLVINQIRLGAFTPSVSMPQLGLIALSQFADEIMSIAILVVITYLMAKRFRGVGTFREQWYTALLIFIPMTIILIFTASASVLGFVFIIYTLWLFADSTSGVHHLSRGRASISIGAAAVVLTPVLILGWLSLPHGF